MKEATKDALKKCLRILATPILVIIFFIGWLLYIVGYDVLGDDD
jgi:hypothetical protein